VKTKTTTGLLVMGGGGSSRGETSSLSHPARPENDSPPAGLGSIGLDRLFASFRLVSYSVREERKRCCLRTRRKTETAAANEITTFPFSKPV